MDFKIVAIVSLLVVVVATAPDHHILSDSYIELINSKQSSWKAGRNFPKNTPLKYLKRLLGVPLSLLQDKKTLEDIPRVMHKAELLANLPEHFDSREKWYFCQSLKEIRDQGSCGSCWAFSTVEVMTDRVCIISKGAKQIQISAEDLITCCFECGSGCDGGNTYMAFEYWQTDGIVSGGNYNSSKGCMPYTIPPCVHHAPGEHVDSEDKKLPCLDSYVDTPSCVDKCEKNYGVSYEDDKSYGKSPELFPKNEDEIMAEIYHNGPVAASIQVTPDFFHYKSGVYVPTDTKVLGGHAIKIIGWGVENGMKYWLIANSWNNKWGNKGFVKIQRGENVCGVEDFVTSGQPDFD